MKIFLEKCMFNYLRSKYGRTTAWVRRYQARNILRRSRFYNRSSTDVSPGAGVSALPAPCSHTKHMDLPATCVLYNDLHTCFERFLDVEV